MISRVSLLALVFLTACQSKPDNATAARDPKEEERFHKAGLLVMSDLQHASAWEKLIHEDMGVPQRKIEVQAGPGYTTVIIKNLKNRSDVEGVAQELRTVAGKEPDKFGPTKVEVRLENAPQTINPFVLPNESKSSLINPGLDLPTLSLPSLQPGGR
ncbi:MAG: hypothetical protein U1F71_07200 [Verrucomicrobiaceae bacterium]